MSENTFHIEQLPYQSANLITNAYFLYQQIKKGFNNEYFKNKSCFEIFAMAYFSMFDRHYMEIYSSDNRIKCIIYSMEKEQEKMFKYIHKMIIKNNLMQNAVFKGSFTYEFEKVIYDLLENIRNNHSISISNITPEIIMCEILLKNGLDAYYVDAAHIRQYLMFKGELIHALTPSDKKYSSGHQKKIEGDRIKHVNQNIKEKYREILSGYGIQHFATVMPIRKNQQGIIMWEDLLDQVLNILYSFNNKSLLLVGPPGCGKTTLVDKIAELIYNKNISGLGYEAIVQIDINGATAGTKYRGDFESNMDKILKFASDNPKCLLYFDEIHTSLSAGKSEESVASMAEILKPKLGETGIRIIGSTTNDEYRNIIKDAGFMRRFRTLYMKEMKQSTLKQILFQRIKLYEEMEHCEINFEESKILELLDFIIQLTQPLNLHHKERYNPDLSIDIIAEAMGRSKRRGDNIVGLEDFSNAVMNAEDISPSVRASYCIQINNLQNQTLPEKRCHLTIIK